MVFELKFTDSIVLSRKSRWTLEEIQFVKSNPSLKDIELSQKLKRSLNSIRAKRRRLGINKKFQSKYDLNMEFFKNWTKEMVYILGYIFADGSIRIRRSGSELSIKSKDLQILKSMNIAMNSNYPISARKTKTGIIHCLTINRKEIVQDLLKLGVIPRKSKTMVFPRIPVHLLYHFTRGYFDGDGYVRILGNSLEIVFTSGSEGFLKTLHETLENQGIKSKVYTKLYNSYSWYILNIFNESREIFYKRLYKNASLFLRRKFLLFHHYFQNHHNIGIVCQDCGNIVTKTGNNQKKCSDCRNKCIKELNHRSYENRKKRGYIGDITNK